MLFIDFQVHHGYKGVVKDAETGKAIPKAKIRVMDSSTNTFSAADGDFWAYAVPGVYSLRIEAEGYMLKETVILILTSF